MAAFEQRPHRPDYAAIDEALGQQHAMPGEDGVPQQTAAGVPAVNFASKLDSDEARADLRRLLNWYYVEREKQAANRLEMAMDADFYDSIQWDPEDAQAVKDRGQMPLVYNEVAPMVDWVIGTERRTRVDWRVLPRTEDDVKLADVKTKVLKYLGDVNHVQMARSRAFADAVKAGVGWVDDGVRDDPTQEPIYSRYEDWRNILYDSASYEPDLSDARYIFRWRWVDVDLAVMMFPDREAQIRSAAETHWSLNDGAEEGDLRVVTLDSYLSARTGRLYQSGAGSMIDAKRPRVRLIEAQWRKPMKVRVVADGAFARQILVPGDNVMAEVVGRESATIIDKLVMRVHTAIFTEAAMLRRGPSPYRHNRFTLTPVWCYRRGSDRLPYGMIRRVRDIQQDLNKRASKALFLLNTNQVIADEGAVADWDVLREEVDRPDGTIIKRPGRELRIQRDTDAATGQIQMMTLDAQNIQKSGGVSQENMGRPTNAVSGEAIKARQLQGSVVTTEPFDNLRFATQISGEKQLSLAEQVMTEQRVVRLTGDRGALEWVRINQPVQQVDGSVVYMNDIASSAADFVVSEQDYAGTLRQVMFESISQMAQRLPPEISVRLLTIALEFSDLPNKDEIAAEIRRITGDRDPNKEPSPEEQQAMAQQQQQQAEMLQMQREQAMLAMQEQQAKVRELNARAAKIEAEAVALSAGPGADAGLGAEAEAMVQQVQQAASQELERLAGELQRVQGELAKRTAEAGRTASDADLKLEVARIDADARIQVAEIQARSTQRLQVLQARIDAMERGVDETLGADGVMRVASGAKGSGTSDGGPAQAGSAGGRARPPAAGASVILQVTGDVSVKADAAQIDGQQGVNIDATDVAVTAQGASMQAGQANVSTSGEMPVTVAGDLKADAARVTMLAPPSAPKTITIVRDNAGRIKGAEVSGTAEPDRPSEPD